MSKSIEIAHRRLLPLTVAAYLLAAAAAQLAPDVTAGETAEIRTAGVHVRFGFHGHYGHHHYYRPHHHYWGYYPYRHFVPYVYYHGTYGVPRYASRSGGLDLNVKPKKTTQVYVDGNYVGLTGDFDGWPEHLWLPASRSPASRGTNTYELIFYNPGFETVVRRVEVQPGVVIKIRHDMQPGESIPPEELTTARPGATAPAPGYSQPTPSAAAPPAPAPVPGERAAPQVLDARQQPARLKLTVAPADASIYLDGRFLGVAGELGEQRSGLLVDPGEHLLEIVRPGYDSREVRFEAEPGGEVELEVELRAGASRAGLSASL